MVKLPFYAKASLTFIGLISLITTLYIGSHIIVPIIYSTIIAIVLSPLVLYWERKRMNRVWAIITSLILVLLGGLVFLGLFSSQLSMFTETFPKLLDKFSETLNGLVTYISNRFNVSPTRINESITEIKNEILNVGKSSIGATIYTLGNGLILMFLIPVYVFMILFYQPLLLEFIRKLFGKEHEIEVNSILTSTKSIIQKYLSALLLEAAIIATLNSVGLLILGIDYAIILGVMGAIINVIPYIGGVIAVALPMIVALGTKSSLSYPLLVMGVYVIIQFVDNHYIIPKIVASKVRINALVSIIVVLVGGALWGVPGMFLSIPLTAIIKVIFDHIEDLKPWGFLLGDTMPPIRVIRIKAKRKEVQLTN